MIDLSLLQKEGLNLIEDDSGIYYISSYKDCDRLKHLFVKYKLSDGGILYKKVYYRHSDWKDADYLKVFSGFENLNNDYFYKLNSKLADSPVYFLDYQSNIIPDKYLIKHNVTLKSGVYILSNSASRVIIVDYLRISSRDFKTLTVPTVHLLRSVMPENCYQICSKQLLFTCYKKGVASAEEIAQVYSEKIIKILTKI